MTRGAAMLLMACLGGFAAPCTAQEIGRLFFTPEQRAALDGRRKARVPDKPAATPMVASPTTRLDGFVRRSAGRSTVWVNGESLGETGAEGASIESGRSTDARVSVPVGDSGARAALKPGQILDRGTGEVRDVIGNGEIQVRRSPK
jgi:hypothetical protein